jgi:hypothetical protein
MTQRIVTLSRYLLRTLVRSLTGGMLLLLAFAYWLVLFNPTIRTPEPEYFISLVGVLGALLALLSTLAMASIANRAESAPFFVRLTSRVEYLAGLLLASMTFTLLVQFVLALVIVFQPGGPELTFGRLSEIPPLWLSLNIISSVIAIHASDFAAKGWSRVYLFGIGVILLFGQQVDERTMTALARFLRRISSWLFVQEWNALARAFSSAAGWASSSGVEFFAQSLGFVFWPFRAIATAVRSGTYDVAQALAPAILLLYATILFMLAADLFATKDLQLVE